MRKDEEFCKENFNKYLINNLGLHPTNWEEGENPPDYYFSLDKQKYVVEVTTIMMKITSKPKALSQQSFQLSLRKLSKHIENISKKQNILNGFYSISYFGPYEKSRQARKLIKKRALDYISKTKDYNNAPEKTIFLKSR